MLAKKSETNPEYYDVFDKLLQGLCAKSAKYSAYPTLFDIPKIVSHLP